VPFHGYLVSTDLFNEYATKQTTLLSEKLLIYGTTAAITYTGHKDPTGD
jgi:hypothetical protein